MITEITLAAVLFNGLLYPEIYIPAQNQMEFDIAGLIPSSAYPTDLLTLTLKGMKVYR